MSLYSRGEFGSIDTDIQGREHVDRKVIEIRLMLLQAEKMTRIAGENKKLGRSKEALFFPSERENGLTGLWIPLQNYETMYPHHFKSSSLSHLLRPPRKLIYLPSKRSVPPALGCASCGPPFSQDLGLFC